MLPSLILCSNNKPFLNQTVMCNEKWIFMWQLATTSSVEGLRRSSKSLPKPNLHQTRVMISVCWSAACLMHFSFLNPGETSTSEKHAQKIGEIHWKLQYLQPISVNRMGPIFLHSNVQPHITQPTLQKLNELGYEVLPHLPYLPDLSPTDYHFFKHLNNFFAEKMLPQPAGGRKCFLRVLSILKHRFLCCSNKQTFLLAKICSL